MEAILERSRELKQALIDYVLDADGDLAVALETFSAEQLAKSSQQGGQQQTLVIDRFLTEGKIRDKTPIDLFVESHAKELSKDDRQLLQNWQRTFIGLFAVTQILPDGFELMNWLTAKHYTVKPDSPTTQKDLERAKPGEIILTRIAPVTNEYWTFSGPFTLMGSLGKPKLAVAIGNFKDSYKGFLYSDAPELLEEAWRSVEKYHQDFLDFFGSDEITMSGYELGKKIAEFQSIIAKKQLAEAGIDESKSMAEIAEEAGIDDDEIEEMAETMGTDAKSVAAMMKSKETVTKMVTPKVELPPELKKAEKVTVLADPRWGQMFLPTYTQFKTLLETEDWQSIQGSEALVRKYLENQTFNAFIWRRLAAAYPTQLEVILQTILERPTFDLETDLDSLLQEYKKPLQPDLPEIASVPLHLHELFQEALAEVSKSKPKDKDKKKAKKGFQR
ncbi:hypothetical protein K9N68_17530 [Kovacikia minuta CCNUW1]|uniref:hypothetical protein n=1 Tax=Kovacikia minuta TaxID=2931930 RepID=UPI001CCCE89A|nr:hypothetical protein [Kovacikia minuta]UBF23584.1 hypothetical protein K9N68_17530 [Kovacikia minuta CCNUW1]